ncbi:acyl-CoA thioester hydrolase/BAAT C-terminal domain-containing protein [Clostridium tyrobutyricum]|uniref:acyl-CoA thioester hydrolase/BAAT C-terminal domain-containing protein n=1 Tax=Clostridium tyrobutyricum TaxID=1519 RepID=UPI00311AB9C6
MADEYGNVDLSKSPSQSGTYTGINSMGLFNTMQLVNENSNGRLTRKIDDIPLYKYYTIQLIVESNGTELCKKEIIRYYQSGNTKSETITGSGFQGRFFYNKDTEKKPGIIVLSGSDGGIEKAQTIAQLFSEHGYNSLALSYFGLEGLPETIDKIPVEYIENSINWLKRQPNINKDKLAIYGRSKGGEMALVAAFLFPQITAVIANTPSSHVFEGFKLNHMGSHTSSWTYNNSELPFISLKFTDVIKFVIKKIFHPKTIQPKDIYSHNIKNNKINKKAEIKTEKINGNILLLSAGKDEIWPSNIFCENIIERCSDFGFQNECIHYNYPDSGHFLTVPYQSLPPKRQNMCNDKYFNDCINSWKATLSFLYNWKNS